jgi:hypothetical protein
MTWDLPNKGMKLTKPERNGALQLIPGVVRTVRRAAMTARVPRRTAALVACLAATVGTQSSADRDVATRERVIAASLRRVVPNACPSAIPCCLSIPEGWVSKDFMTRLRGLALRMDGADPLLGECAGRRASVRSLDWTGPEGARVEIVFGGYSSGETCTVSLSRASGTWAVVKSVCEFYSIL